MKCANYVSVSSRQVMLGVKLVVVLGEDECANFQLLKYVRTLEAAFI
jgi:hypothetical protein